MTEPRFFVDKIDDLLRELDTSKGAFRDMAVKDAEALEVNLKRARACADNLAASLNNQDDENEY